MKIPANTALTPETTQFHHWAVLVVSLSFSPPPGFRYFSSRETNPLPPLINNALPGTQVKDAQPAPPLGLQVLIGFTDVPVSK